MRRVLVVAASAAALSLSMLAAPVNGAGAAQVTAEPPNALHGFADITVDTVHSKVFVSEATSNSVAVADAAGHVQSRLTGLTGAAGLLLSPDSSTLYVALSGADAIAEIDTTTLVVTRIPLGDQTCPQTLAIAQDLLWVGYGCGSGSGDLAAVDPVTSTVHLGLATGWYYNAPVLASRPERLPSSLFATSPGVGPDELRLLTVTGGADPQAEVTEQTQIPGFTRDLAVTADGAHLLAAPGRDKQRFRTADLQPDGLLATPDAPNALAVRSDGMVAAGLDEAYSPDVYVFRSGESKVYRTFNFRGHYPGQSGFLQQGGLAFGTTKLFAVTGDVYGNVLRLHALLPKHLTSLTVHTNKTTYSYGERAVVTAHLGSTATNRIVSIWATPYGGSKHLVKRGRVNAAGNLVATPTVVRRTTFTATFTGDADSSAASAHVVRAVRARVVNALHGFYGTSGTYHLYRVHTNPVLSTTVSPNLAGACVYFRAQYHTSSGWRLYGATKCLKLNEHSRSGVYLGGTHYVGEQVRMRAEWHGNPSNLAANGPWQYLRFTS